MLPAAHTGHRMRHTVHGLAPIQFASARRVRQVQRAAQSAQCVRDRSNRSQLVWHSLRAALDHCEQLIVSLGVQRVRLRHQLFSHVHNRVHEHLLDGRHLS